jgi:hypothetical protein
MLAHLMTVLELLFAIVAGLALLTHRIRPPAPGLIPSDVGGRPGTKNRDDDSGYTGNEPGGSVAGYKGCSSDGSGSR